MPYRRLLSTTLLLYTITVPAQGQTRQAKHAPRLLDASQDRLLNDSLYRTPSRLVSRIASSGAVGENAAWEQQQHGSWYIEQQRHCGDLIQAGLARKKDDLVQEAVRLMAWGFDRQDADGSFRGTGDAFHSTSMFVEGAARGLLLLKESNDRQYADIVARYEPKVLAAARWLMQPKVAVRGNRNGAPYTHRRWVLAAALGETARLTGDDAMALAAADYAREGLALQESDGTNPEKGGFDVNYQAFGILQAARFSMTSQNADLKSLIRTMIQRGLQREIEEVDEQGSVSAFTSTRTEQERGHNGKTKSIDYKVIVQALVLGSQVTDDSQFHEAAERIAAARKWISAR